VLDVVGYSIRDWVPEEHSNGVLRRATVRRLSWVEFRSRQEALKKVEKKAGLQKTSFTPKEWCKALRDKVLCEITKNKIGKKEMFTRTWKINSGQA